jgi:hypothetical protein
MPSVAELNALALELHLPKLTVNFGSNDLGLKMIRAKGDKLRGGTQIVQDVIYQYTKGGAFTRGTVFNTSGEQNATSAKLSYRYYNFPVGPMFWQDELEVSGAPEIHSFMETKFTAANQGATEKLCLDFYSGGGTDSSAIVNSLDNACDNASGTLQTTTTYAGIDKAVDTWWAGKVVSLGGGAGNGPVYPSLQKVWTPAHDGNIHPNVVLVHSASFDSFMGSQQPQQQYVDNTALQAGFRAAPSGFNGVPLVADNHVPYVAGASAANRIYMLNTDYINFYTHKDGNFVFIPWKEAYDQAAKIAYIRIACNLLVIDPRRCSVGYNFNPDVITAS